MARYCMTVFLRDAQTRDETGFHEHFDITADELARLMDGYCRSAWTASFEVWREDLGKPPHRARHVDLED